MNQRIGCIQPARRLIDFHLTDLEEILRAVDNNIDALAQLVDRAGQDGCDAAVLPEDTLGLEHWAGINPELRQAVLVPAVEAMLARLGATAAQHQMHLVCCSDHIENGQRYNTAFFIGRDGREIGRYRKINMPYSELGARTRGEGYPVFNTPELGDVGMLICYDMVFPEAIRCLALNGADIVFVPTLGGAAMAGGRDMDRAAFRTRAVDNFVYLAIAMRDSGSMIIAPNGEVLAEGAGPDEVLVADIEIAEGREGGNAFDWHRDMRTRLFRERAPESYGVLTQAEPPVLKKLPNNDTPEEITERCSRVLTVGEEAFRAADLLVRSGEIERAKVAFAALCTEYRGSWIERVGKERLQKMGDQT
jgi:predicted amidohydrolase